LDYLKTLDYLYYFIYGNKPEYTISFYLLEQPKNLSEGMAYKYKLFQTEIPDDVYIYLDVDCLILQSMYDYLNFYERDLLNVHGKIFRNILCVMPEGKLSNTCYCGDLIEITPDLKDKIGYSAGHFVFTSSKILRELFQRIISSIEVHSKAPMLTLDQPILNNEIIKLNEYVNGGDFAIVNLDEQKMDINVLDNSVKNAYLLNLCGVPGDSKLHFLKAMFYLCGKYSNLT
jgi:hypothetical protein